MIIPVNHPLGHVKNNTHLINIYITSLKYYNHRRYKFITVIYRCWAYLVRLCVTTIFFKI